MSKTSLRRDMTLGEAFRVVAERYSRRTALVDGNQRISYGDLYDQTMNLADAMRDLGIRKGDPIVTLLWAEAAFIKAFFASAILGAVIIPLPPRMRRNQLEELILQVKPAMVITSAQLEVEGGMETLIGLQRSKPWLKEILRSDAPAFDTYINGNKKPIGRNPHPETVKSEDLLAILFTSGTTGTPKGVMHSHRGLISPVVASIRLREMWMAFFPSLRRLKRWVKVLLRYGMRLVEAAGRQQVFLSTMAVHTISGLEAMLQAILMGDRLVLLPKFHPTRVLETIQRERVTVLIAVPMSYLAILRVPDLDQYRLSSLIICATGAAPCPSDLARRIQNRFRCAVHIGFGMTELGGGIAATSLEDSPDSQAETVGVPMDGIEVQIMDEQHQPLPAGEVGELACRSDGMMMGYFGQEQSADGMVDKEGWLFTGDLAFMDDKGYLHIVGRKKDVIIRGGQNIYPARIENSLTSLAGLTEAAVVGIPDSFGGESVWAYVLVADDKILDEKQIRAHCRAQLEAHEIPQHIRIVDEFPRSSSGKPQKFKLREFALQEAIRDDKENGL